MKNIKKSQNLMAKIESKNQQTCLEVIKALAKLENKYLEDIIDVANQKKIKRGSFNDKIFLEKVITDNK